MSDMQIDRTYPSRSAAARLLAEVGERVSARLADRLAELDLTPAQLAVLRRVGQAPGSSQQALSRQLGVGPSRVLKLVDELEAQGLIERRPNPRDRRRHQLHIKETAQDRIEALRLAVEAHEQELAQTLAPAELDTLVNLLRKVEAAYAPPPSKR